MPAGPLCGGPGWVSYKRKANMAAKRKVKVKKTAKYYRDNPEARKKKAEYDTAYHSTPSRKKYRRKLAKARRKAGVMGKGGKDMSHTKSGKLVREDASANRARNGAGGKAKRK